MSQVSRNTVKTWFETGDRPTQQQFYDWLESVIWYDEAAIGAKVYIALLTQTGTNAPVATVIKNTLSGTPVWSRTSATDMRATLAGEFIENKTVVFITNGANGAFSAGGQRLDDDTIKLSPPGDSQISNTSIEIRVYP